MKARLLSLLLVASVAPLSQALFPGCATLIDGPMQHVNVQTKPAGAQIYLNGRLVGNTPATVVVSRWGFHRLRIEMPGYKPLDLPLEKRFNDYASGNLFIGGGWIAIDAVTGAVFQFDVSKKAKADVHAQAISEGIFGPETLEISTTLKPDSAAHRLGQLERR